MRPPLLARDRRAGERPTASRPLDQLKPARDDIGGIAPLDRIHIGGIHHRQPQIGGAVPHRHRRRLDQPGQRLIRLTEPRSLRSKPGDLRLAVGRIESPEQHSAGRAHIARRTPTPERDRPRRPEQLDRAHERPPRPLRRRNIRNQPSRVVWGQPGAPGRQFGQRPRRRIEPQPVRHTLRHLDPPARPDHRHDCRRTVEDRLQLRTCFYHARGLGSRAQTHENENTARGDQR
jgi:hypothetical protein